jgi:hypothetical protein
MDVFGYGKFGGLIKLGEAIKYPYFLGKAKKGQEILRKYTCCPIVIVLIFCMKNII